MTIELNGYGFMIDSNWFYVALSWELIVSLSVATGTILAYKKWKNRK